MHWGREGKVSKRWAGSARWHLNRNIIPHIGDRDAATFGVKDVALWHSKISQQGARGKPAPGSANRAKAVLSKAYELHIKWETPGIVRNPCKGVESNPERKMERFLNPDEYTRFWETMTASTDVDRYARAAIMLIALTGCRQGEVRQLKWDEYKADKRRIELEHHKTAKYTGVKRLPLSDASIGLLSDVAGWQEEDELEGFAYVFPRYGKGRVRKYKDEPHGDLGKFWRQLRARMKLEDVRMHDLRHSFASVAAQQGMTLQMIGSLLGHSNITTTQRYAHLLDSEREQAAESIGSAIDSMKKI